MPDTRPVIIVGAPRSGTSLIQRLIREIDGFESVPKESDMIWLPYCHPETNDWKYEGCPSSRITDTAVGKIRSAFSDQALSAASWRIFDRAGLMERPRLAAALRLGHRTLFKPWARIRKTTGVVRTKHRRLVDKSVHAGLWLNLVDAVFPDAVYIYMIRSPVTCIPSMIQGWQSPDRFKTYRIPSSIEQPRRDTSGWWCFPMPPGWRTYYHASLVDICTFQWTTINHAIVEHFSEESVKHRVLQIHLEDLSADPEKSLRDIARFLHIEASALGADDAIHLPVVNARTKHHNVDPATISYIQAHTDAFYASLIRFNGGYL